MVNLIARATPRSALLALCVFVAGCAAPGKKLPVGAWVVDASESEKYLLANPPVGQMDASFVWIAGLSCSMVFTVTPDGQLRLGIPREPQKTTYTRVERGGDQLTYETGGNEGKRHGLTASLQGQHMRLDDGDSLKYLLWRRSDEKDPTPDIVVWGPEDACLGPLQRIWERYGPKQ